MADPELPAAADDNTRLAAQFHQFQSKHRESTLAAFGLGPDASPAADPLPLAAAVLPLTPARADETGEDEIRRAVENFTFGSLEEAQPAGMRIKRELFDRAEDLIPLKNMQAEYRRLGEERHGAYADVNWLLEADPQLVGRLPAGAKRALADFEQAQRTGNNLDPARESLCDQIGRAAGITNQQLQELINRNRAHSAAELRYEEILKEHNPQANPGFRDAFNNRNQVAIEFYNWAIGLRRMRVEYLQGLGLIPGQAMARPPEAVSAPPPAATLRPDATPARLSARNDVPDANRATEDIEAVLLMDFVNRTLRACQEDATAIEVSPATLAQFLKEAVKIRVGKFLLKEITSGFPSIPVLRPVSIDGEEALLFSGTITAPLGAEVVFDNVMVINSPRGEGLAVSYRDQDITCKGKAAAQKDKVKATLDNFGQELIEGINARLRDKKWQVSNVRIENGRVRFEFKKKLKPRLNRKQQFVSALGAAALAITPLLGPRPNETHLPPTNPQVTPAQTKTAEPEAKAIENRDLFKEFLKPFIEEALKKRAERAKIDPEYFHRVDQEFNRNRINLLIFGYGEEHGEPYENYGGSISILSLDLTTNKIGAVHLSRDIRLPEIEQRMPPDKRTPMAIRHVYMMGGTELMQLAAEDATGLAIDFQVVAKDVALRDALNQLTDGFLEIEAPKEHDTGPFRLDRVEYEGGVIPAGWQQMDTMQLMRYVLAEDKKPQGKEDERSYRKSEVMRALIQVAKDKLRQDPRFLLTVINFVKEETTKGNLSFDFDLNLLLRTTQLTQGIFNAALGYLTSLGQGIEWKFPEEDRNLEVIVHDPSFGDGGVRRVHAIREDPEVRRLYPTNVVQEADSEYVLPQLLMPEGGDPKAQDLVSKYWQSIRALVKQKLS